MIDIDLPERLLDELREATGRTELSYARAPEPLSGGFWAELYLFSLSGAPAAWPHELVARAMPDEALAYKETVVQSAVAAAGFSTPVVRASGNGSGALGRAYMVMDRAPGAPLLDGLDGVSALVRAAPRLARRVPDVLAQSMAALHALDPTPVRRELAGVSGATADMVGLVDALTGGANACGRRDLETAATQLTARVCALDGEVICHGDLHPFNLLIDRTGAVTVLDWTTSLVAPRMYDVAFTTVMLSEPPLAVPEQLRPVVRRIGRRLAARFVRSYERGAGAKIDAAALASFQAVICLRALVEVAFWVTSGTVDQHAGHPWITNGDAFAARLSLVSGVDVRAR